ncbi:LysR family transcriptional regulator [Kushneria indalinina]|uniref:DNA-binding transcriptional LysR family regulator n=1 Tax=Kushneria indalinina DSM 14324 TaxID=1122140 RepID=A0A3D9DYU7_9GAMM|nr:LysR family transcriptional regulator [Kushneria indalinina]REC95957.1 DNA-binding transcriptional LysR family regulator [Kushneria indalinina DSM 14324]
METESLRAFVAVAECGSFSLAAEQIHLTQSAVSKRIATLESQTDARLFDRIGRRIALTEAGHTLLPRAREILGMFEDTQRALTRLSGTVRGRLSLATSHHIGLHRLPPVLRDYTRRWPDVRLDMRFMDSEQAYQGVLDGSLELALATLAPQTAAPLVAIPLWVDQLRFVCAPDHALAREPSLTLSQLSRVDAVLPGEQTFTRAMVVNTFAREGLDVGVAMSTNFLETLKMMVSIGLGWSVLPETLIDDSVHRLDIDHPPIERPLGYLFHENRTLSNAARAMIDLLEASRQAPDQV